MNVRVTLESLLDFYGEFDASKSEASIKELYGKCAKMSSSKSDCEGGPASDLISKLHKKYKNKPVSEPRVKKGESDEENGENEEKAQKSKKEKPKREKKEPKKKEKKEPNLDVATLDELERAVAERRIALGLPPVVEATIKDDDDDIFNDDDDDEDDEDDVNPKTPWVERSEPERVVIIGSGPAGLASAIYAARAGLKPVVVAPAFGGQLMGKGVDVENYPGLLGQTGPGVVNLMIDQAASFGTVKRKIMLIYTTIDVHLSPVLRLIGV